MKSSVFLDYLMASADELNFATATTYPITRRVWVKKREGEKVRYVLKTYEINEKSRARSVDPFPTAALDSIRKHYPEMHGLFVLAQKLRSQRNAMNYDYSELREKRLEMFDPSSIWARRTDL